MSDKKELGEFAAYLDKEGPFAFPFVVHGAAACTGMKLRDYFAAQALPAVLAQETDGITERYPNGPFMHPEYQGHRMTTAQWWAEQAYQIADAMLAARGAA